jgi:LysM domain
VHGEQRFDGRLPGPVPPSRRALHPGGLGGPGGMEERTVTTAFVTAAWPATGEPCSSSRPELRVVEGAGLGASPARHRRLLVAVIVALSVALALPLSGTGGRSHATGSAPAGNGHPVEYTVRPGDTLWSIAERVEPTGDPRPLVEKLAAQTGSDTVEPGERIVLP